MCACLNGVVANAGERVDESKAVPLDAIISINNVRGDIEITGWDKPEVAITGELDDLAESLIFEVNGSDVRIRVVLPRKDVNWGDGSDLHIKVPTGSRIAFEGVSTDLDIKNIEGGAHLRTVSGDIEVQGIGTQLTINTVSGDIEASTIAGRTQVTTISGDVELSASATDVGVDTVSGRLQVELAKVENLYLRSVSGEIEIEGNLLPEGCIDASSVSGEITLSLVRPVNAELQIRSGIGAEINNGFTGAEPKKVFPNQQELIAVAGDGNGRISVRTVSSDIVLN